MGRGSMDGLWKEAKLKHFRSVITLPAAAAGSPHQHRNPDP